MNNELNMDRKPIVSPVQKQIEVSFQAASCLACYASLQDRWWSLPYFPVLDL